MLYSKKIYTRKESFMLKTLFSSEKKDVEKLEEIAKRVDALSDKYSELTDIELKNKTNEFKERMANGETLEQIQIEAFATVREVAKRVRGEFPYLVQIMGACAIVDGNIAEMKTGEGKTLTATMAVYLRALEGKGVHVVTVNEYLAKRDAEEMGKIYKFLGLSVGVNLQEMSPERKRKAYKCDITYTTNAELGFDYLRDNMVFNKASKVQRGLHFVLIDEADSVLIDEARTPLIISGQSEDESETFYKVDQLVKQLTYADYKIFVKEKDVVLLPLGIKKLEVALGISDLYELKHQSLLNKINKSLHANIIMKNNVDYIVKDGEVLIVDQFTGRVMPGREFSDGLHQAIQAKEGVKIKPESKTIASITYQNFFRLYDYLAGMTGTAKTEEEEFISIYNMKVLCIPTNKPVAREDKLDIIYKMKDEKFSGIVQRVEKLYKKGQPVLIGTADVKSNEILSAMLKNAHIPHEVLNAKNHKKEAEIIRKAGQVKAVTLATNMAGRGTDIKLSDEARTLGGLYVIGTERHESRRIDNQLRGRSGRQGDPGASEFIISLQDDLLRRYGGDMMHKMAKTLPDGEIQSKSLTKAITNAQKMVEAVNFDVRKQLIEYDDVLRQQREIFFARREQILEGKPGELYSLIKKNMDEYIENTFNRFDDKKELCDYLNKDLKIVNLKDRTYRTPGKIFEYNDGDTEVDFQIEAWSYFEKLILAKDKVAFEMACSVSRVQMLKIYDFFWQNHINDMDKLKSEISLRGYAQKKPAVEYAEEGYELFDAMIHKIDERIIQTLFMLRPVIQYEG